MQIRNLSGTRPDWIKDATQYAEGVVGKLYDETFPFVWHNFKYAQHATYGPMESDENTYYVQFNQVPIILLNSHDVRHFDKPTIERQALRQADENRGKGLYVCADELGLYVRGDFDKSYAHRAFAARPMIPGKRPAWIVLYSDKIHEAARNDQEARMLFTLALIHETMHSLMDQDAHACWPDSEEVMANALSLYLIDKSGDKALLSFAKRFVQTQPFAYKLGGEYHKHFGPIVPFLAANYILQKDNGWRGFEAEWTTLVTAPRRNWTALRDLELVRGQEVFYKYAGSYYACFADVVLGQIRLWMKRQRRKSITVEALKAAFPDALNANRDVALFKRWPSGVEGGFEQEREVFEQDDPEGLGLFWHTSDATCVLRLADGNLVVADDWDKKGRDGFLRHCETLGLPAFEVIGG